MCKIISFSGYYATRFVDAVVNYSNQVSQQEKETVFFASEILQAVSRTLNLKKEKQGVMTELSVLKTTFIPDAEKPSLLLDSFRLFRDNFLPIFAAHYAYAFLEHQHALNKENLPGTINYLYENSLPLLSVALFTFTLFQKIPFHVRTAVMLVEYPKIFYAMPKPDNYQYIDDAICVECNKLRYMKGEIIDLLVYFFTQILLWIITIIPDLVPYLVAPLPLATLLRVTLTIFSYLVYPITVFTLGQAMATYLYAHALCYRHRRVNFQQYREIFMFIGLLQQISVFALTSLTVGVVDYFKLSCRQEMGDVFLLTSLIEALNKIPRSVYDFYFSGIVTFLMIKLTYSISFPKTVGITNRYFPDLGVHGFVSKLYKHTILEFKENLINNNGDNSWGRWSEKKIIAWLSDKKESWWLKKFLQDPIIARSWPVVLRNINEGLDAILSYRKSMMEVLPYIEKINSIFSKRLPKIALQITVGSLVADATQIFTKEFITITSPKLLPDILSVLNALREYKIISKEKHSELTVKIMSIQKNVLMLRKILNELPDSVIHDFLVWTQSDRCFNLITLVMRTNTDMLVRNTNEWNELSESDAAQEEEESCCFPGDAELDAVMVKKPSEARLDDYDVVEAAPAQPRKKSMFKPASNDFVDIDSNDEELSSACFFSCQPIQSFRAAAHGSSISSAAPSTRLAQ